MVHSKLNGGGRGFYGHLAMAIVAYFPKISILWPNGQKKSIFAFIAIIFANIIQITILQCTNTYYSLSRTKRLNHENDWLHFY